MRDRVAYLHVPKSAGTSIRRAMRDHVAEEQMCPWTIDPLLYGSHPLPTPVHGRIFHDGVDNLHDYVYMAGHLSLPTIERGFNASDISCILREPRSRLLSQYTFWRTYSPEELASWEPYEVPYLSRLSLGDFLRQGAVMHFADNLTTRMIVGRHELIPLDDPIPAERADEVAELACAQLDRLGFVDLLERGDEATVAFEAWLGAPIERDTVNVTDSAAGAPIDVDDLVSSSTLQLLDEHNAVDMALWLHVAERRGFSPAAARRLADATFAASVAKVVRRTFTTFERQMEHLRS